MRLHAVVQSEAPATELARLPLELERYVEIEPRLVAARWLTAGGPAVGARAEAVVDIPFTVGVLRAHFAHPTVVATITQWVPDASLEATFEESRFAGRVRIEVNATEGGAVVRVDGEVVPTRRLIRTAIRPLTPLLDVLATNAIVRGVERASRALMSGGSHHASQQAPREARAVPLTKME